MEENEGWAMFRRAIIIVAILLLILAPIFLYVYLERGLEGDIDWFADRIIGVMFAGLLAGAFVLFDKLSNKLSNKQEWTHHIPCPQSPQDATKGVVSEHWGSAEDDKYDEQENDYQPSQIDKGTDVHEHGKVHPLYETSEIFGTQIDMA